MARNVSYRLEESEIRLIDGLAEAVGISKTEVIRLGIKALRDLIVVAQADAGAVLEVLRDRYEPDAEVAIWVTEGADGEPEAHVRISGAEPADLGARALKSSRGDSVLLFLDPSNTYADLAVPVGDKDAVWVRPRFNVGELPWPPQPLRIVLSLGDVAPTASPEMSIRLEQVEA